MSDDLVKRLRKRLAPPPFYVPDQQCSEAADRIEELEAALRLILNALGTLDANCALPPHISVLRRTSRGILDGTPIEQPLENAVKMPEAPEQ